MMLRDETKKTLYSTALAFFNKEMKLRNSKASKQSKDIKKDFDVSNLKVLALQELVTGK